jgi:Uncharacterized protein conserved in bacteria
MLFDDMKKKTKVIIVLAAVAVLISGYFLLDYLDSVNRYRRAIREIEFTHYDASGIPDGSYTGECDVDFIYARVEVHIENEQIIKIALLEHRHERGADAGRITQDIINQQRIDVDAVAGVTYSSQVIKKAVDNALSNAMEQ